MTYKPGTKESNETLDFAATAANAVDARAKDDKSSLQNLKPSCGKTLEQQLPEVCPLVFPELEKASDEQKENAFKRALNFSRDYYDRRGHAEFASQNPDSKLTVKEHEFESKYGDPKTFENSGLLGVMTAGRIDPKQRLAKLKNRRREQSGRRSGTAIGGLREKKGFVKKKLGEGVLYLLIVNMPSEAELQAAKEAEEKMKREQPNWFEKLMSTR